MSAPPHDGGASVPRPEWSIRPRPAVLAQAMSELGRAGVVGLAITGAAGSGKTTLATQIGTEAGANGAVLLVRGSAFAAEIPYGALAPYLDELPENVTSAAGPPNPLVAIRALQNRLRRLGGPGDPLVVVDNLAYVDEHSAHVLAALAGSGALRLLVVADDVTAGPDAIVDLWRDGLLGAVVVPGWAPDEVDAAVTSYLGDSVSASLRRHLHRSSGGNPMLLRHLVEHGVLSGGLVRSDGTWTFDAFRWSSPDVSGLLSAPLARWSTAQRQVLELISLTDRVPLAGVEQMLAPDQLESLERAGMVTVDGPGNRYGAGGSPTVRLGSPALARAISRHVPRSRRRSILETARAIGVGSGDPTAHQELALAELVLDTGAVLDPALAVRAANTALLHHDPTLALRLSGAVPDGEHLSPATVLRSQALRSLGQLQEAIAALEDLRARRWPAMTAAERVAWAVERADTVRYAPPADRHVVLAMLDSLRAATPTDDTYAGGMLDMAWASLAFSGGRYAELVDRLPPIHAAGAGAGVERWTVCGSILAAALAALGRQQDAVVAAEEVERVWRLGELPADLATVVLAGLNVALLTCGQWGRVQENISLQGAQDPYRDPRDGGVNDLGLGLVHLLRGDGHRARTPLRSAVAETALRDAYQMAGLTRAALAWAEALAGNEEAARAELARYSPTTWLDYDGPVSPQFSLSGARLELGDDVTQEVVARGRALLDAGHYGNAAVVLSQAARHGSTEAVQLLRLMPMDQPGPWMRAARDHAEGIARGDAGLLVRTAQQLLADGDRRFAAEVGTAALAVTGAPADVVRAAARVLQLARRGNVPAGDGGRGPLTPRERDVAERAARRLTNAEIAASLHLSVRTVESYLQSAFGKLGINSRTELAAALSDTTHGPTLDPNSNPAL
ncbi:MAG: LuxR C-terminal-related transcriptional regulator [Nakamurella sp.]